MASRFADLEAIKQLKARYFRLLDTQQWAEWAEVFSEDAELQWGPKAHHVMAGREAIVAGVSGNLLDATTCHHGHMPEIEFVDDTHATGVWAMHDIVDHPDYFLEGYGHYHDEYLKRDGQWRIHRTKLTRLRETRDPKQGSGG